MLECICSAQAAVKTGDVLWFLTGCNVNLFPSHTHTHNTLLYNSIKFYSRLLVKRFSRKKQSLQSSFIINNNKTCLQSLIQQCPIVIAKVELTLFLWKVKVTRQLGKVLWPLLGICALQLTHPKCTHTAVNTHPEQWHLSCGIKGGEHAVHSTPTYKSCWPKTRTRSFWITSPTL